MGKQSNGWQKGWWLGLSAGESWPKRRYGSFDYVPDLRGTLPLSTRNGGSFSSILGDERAGCCLDAAMDGLRSSAGSGTVEATFPLITGLYHFGSGVGEAVATLYGALGAGDASELSLPGQRLGSGERMHNRAEEGWIRLGLCPDRPFAVAVA